MPSKSDDYPIGTEAERLIYARDKGIFIGFVLGCLFNLAVYALLKGVL